MSKIEFLNFLGFLAPGAHSCHPCPEKHTNFKDTNQQSSSKEKQAQKKDEKR